MLELVADVQVSCMASVLCSFLIVLAEAWLRVCAAIQHLRERASTARLCPGTNDVGTFVVGAATMSDVHELTGLFMKDYMECHRRMHANVRGTAAEWLTALGEIDFEAVLQEVSGGSGSSVRLLKCSNSLIMMSVALAGASVAFVPPATMQPLTRTTAVADVTMMARNAPRASPTKPVVDNKAKPLSPGSNYPATKNIQTQRNGFGSFVQKFQTVSGKSKYGVPIFLPNGNVNPAYLAAERKDMAAQSKKNMAQAEVKRKGLISGGTFELADYIKKKIGEVGSGKDYYQSGR